jgi:hypothetical protein
LLQNADGMEGRREPPDLMVKAARELSACMDGVAPGSPLLLDASSGLSGTLERLVPQLLAVEHGEWRGESLDGFYFSSAVKSDDGSAVLTGLCMLLSDQTLTPFIFNLSLSDEAELGAIRIRLGEPGEGHLGISGPAWGSSEVLKSLWTLEAQLETVDWAYDVSINP